MSPNLSPGEVEALHQAPAAPAGSPSPAPAPEIETRDFRRPKVCSRQNIEDLKVHFRNVAAELGKNLSQALKLSAQAELISLQQERFESVIETFPTPLCAYRIKMDPLPAQALLLIDISTVLAATDRLYGGSGKIKFEPRELRPAEKPIVDRLAAKAAEAFAKGLAGVLKFTPSIGGTASSKKEAAIFDPSDAVLATAFGTSGDLPPGEIRIVIPFANLKSLVHTSGKAADAPKSVVAPVGSIPPAIVSAIQPFPVEAAAYIGPGRLLVGELMTLEPGDVIPLEARVGDRSIVSIAGVPTYEARLGSKEGRFAVEIEAIIPGGRIGAKK